MTYFVVPKGRSIIKQVATKESFYEAQQCADKLHAETGEHYDIIQMSNVYSTRTVGEALKEDLAQ